VPIDVSVRWGTPWLELVRAVLRDGHDLVVKTAAGAAGRHPVFFGSTALHLLRKCPSAVWIVAGAEAPPIRRVVAALDPMARDSVRTGLAERIVENALDVSAAFEADLHVLSAWRATGERILREHMTSAELGDFVEAARATAAEGLRKALAPWGGAVPEQRVHLLRGVAHEVIPDWVAQQEADLLVLGTLGRAGLPGRLIGETAETVVRSVRCSVWALKPPGFMSPVRLDDDDGDAAA
jgi:nucleotide-binding universal stress UspA family protein